MAAPRIDPARGEQALAEFAAGTASTAQLALAVRYSLALFARAHPGRSVEVRVPPFGAISCVAGPVHTRGTPPCVVQMDPATWLGLSLGSLSWATAVATHAVEASGQRSDLSHLLPHLCGVAGD